MKFYYLFFESPFYWVRTSAIEDPLFAPPDLHPYALFRERRIPGDAVLVFNRFGHTGFFRRAYTLLKQNSLPYVVDIDDLFWQLPDYSADTEAKNSNGMEFIERLLNDAAVITCPSPELLQRLNERYRKPKKILVENCSPGWCDGFDSAIIANTDSLKMKNEEIVWFSEVIKEILAAGMGVHVVGENENLFPYLRGLPVTVIPRVTYREYLRLLTLGKYRLGLVPVSNCAYADCKSSIKLQEFVSAGMNVVASSIAPYRRMQAEFPGLPLTIVENTQNAWRDAIRPHLAQLDRDKSERCKKVCSMIAALKKRQSEQWLEVKDALAQYKADAGAAARVNASLNRIRLVKDCIRTISGKVKRLTGREL